MGIKVVYAEGFLRLLALVLSVVTALVVGLDQQTKQIIFGVERTAKVKSLHALWVLTLAASAAAGYNLLQFIKCLAVAKFAGDNRSRCRKWEAWLCFALDQVAMYAVLGTAASATQGSFTAVVGSTEMQWRKICNMYTRFCVEIGAGLAMALGATMAMSMVSVLSSHQLFQMYPRGRVAQQYNQQQQQRGSTDVDSRW